MRSFRGLPKHHLYYRSGHSHQRSSLEEEILPPCSMFIWLSGPKQQHHHHHTLPIYTSASRGLRTTSRSSSARCSVSSRLKSLGNNHAPNRICRIFRIPSSEPSYLSVANKGIPFVRFVAIRLAEFVRTWYEQPIRTVLLVILITDETLSCARTAGLIHWLGLSRLKSGLPQF